MKFLIPGFLGGIHNNLKIRGSARVSRSRSSPSCKLFLDIFGSRKFGMEVFCSHLIIPALETRRNLKGKSI